MAPSGKSNKKKSNNKKAQVQVSQQQSEPLPKSIDYEHGYMTPTADLLRLKYVEPAAADWKDDVIEFYRNESIIAWKCFYAASLERYEFLLELNRKALDIEESKLPKKKTKARRDLEEDIYHRRTCLNIAEVNAAARFLAALKAVNSGVEVNGIEPVDPDAPVSHFHNILNIVAAATSSDDTQQLDSSFTGSTVSEDSGCSFSPREFSLSKPPGVACPEDLLKLKGSMESVPRGRADARKKVVSTMTQWEDVGSSLTAKTDNATQTDIESSASESINPNVKTQPFPLKIPEKKKTPPEVHSTGSRKDEKDKNLKGNGNVASTGTGSVIKSANGTADGVGVSSAEFNDVQRVGKGSAGPEDRKFYDGKGKKPKISVAVDKGDRDKQIEDDELFAKELAKAWGMEENHVVQPHNAPQSARGSRHDSSTGLETFAAITSAEKDDHAAIYNTRKPNRKYAESSYLNKTGICWNYQMKKPCPWGKDCIYAHGEKELRPIPDWFKKTGGYEKPKTSTLTASHPEPCDYQQCPGRLQFHLRKTSLCKQFQADRCKYSKAECGYAHGQRDLLPLPKHELCLKHINKKCTLKSTECVYAHSEAELRPVNGRKRTAGLSRYPTKHGSSAGEAWANSADHYAFQFPSDERNGEHNSEDCIICSEVFSSKAGRYRLSCGHSCFHSKCIKQWLERDPSCPMCRRPIPEVVDIFKAPLGGKTSDYPPLTPYN